MVGLSEELPTAQLELSALKTLLDEIGVSTFAKDYEGRFTAVSPQFCQLLGVSEEVLLGRRACEIPEIVGCAIFAGERQGSAQEGSSLGSVSLTPRYRVAKAPLLNLDGETVGESGLVLDLTACKRDSASAVRTQAIFEANPDALVVLSHDRVLSCNPAAQALLGIGSREELDMLTVADFLPRRQPCGTASLTLGAEYLAKVQTEGAVQFDMLVRPIGGAGAIPVEVRLGLTEFDGHVMTLVSMRDCSKRKAQEAQAYHLATHDTLTGLPNRRLLGDRLSQALARSRREQVFGAVVYLDLDNFKPLNDTYGHDVGDVLLKMAARRLEGVLREEDTVARWGGDEFVVLLPNLSRSAQTAQELATHVAERIRGALSTPYVLRMPAGVVVTHQCSASLGVSLLTPQDVREDDILKRADTAMYEAKEKGRNGVTLA
jgi:diguanylate cyclase (GGDEF)-like protein